ncbi:MAG: hypothetical protein AB8B64_05260 [Granulosicoccus sp.]
MKVKTHFPNSWNGAHFWDWHSLPYLIGASRSATSSADTGSWPCSEFSTLYSGALRVDNAYDAYDASWF